MRSYIWLGVVAVLVWWLFRSTKASAGTGVISAGGPDFDPITANQLTGEPTGDVTIGDEWSASFTVGNGNWSDPYRSHANEPDEPGGIPL